MQQIRILFNSFNVIMISLLKKHLKFYISTALISVTKLLLFAILSWIIINAKQNQNQISTSWYHCPLNSLNNFLLSKDIIFSNKISLQKITWFFSYFTWQKNAWNKQKLLLQMTKSSPKSIKYIMKTDKNWHCYTKLFFNFNLNEFP